MLSGRLERFSQVLEIISTRHARLVYKPFLVHYADTSSLQECKKSIKQIKAFMLCDIRW